MSTMPQTTPPMPEPEAPELSTAAAPVNNKRIAATGVIPKRMQSWIFLSVLLVTAVGLWFSSGSTKTAKPKPGTVAAPGDQVKPPVGGLSPDEVQTRLKESEQASRNVAANQHSSPPQGSDAQFKAAFGDSNQPSTDTHNTLQNPPTRDPIQEDERKREYTGRFASNIALSYRSDPHAGAASTQSPANQLSRITNASELPAASALQSGLPALPADFQQQLDLLQAQQEKLLSQQQQQLAAATGIPPGSVPHTQTPAQSTPAATHRNPNLNQAMGKDHVIFEGTVLESVLVNRLNGDFAGPVICQISTDVYSHDHAELLIPAGSRILGETKKVNDVGQERLAVIFHRLIMPDGYAVELDQAPGLNQIGETALRDKVNNHYFKIFGASIAVGAIAGLSTIGTNNSAVTGLPTSNASAYREGVAGSLSQSSLRILDKFLNIPPTITIREGHRVRVFLTQDLLLPAYSNHRMPSDL
ncbi:MAG TPA: TrbI/VirB10 family protein [Candidatus Angelobacter sp.]|jgi:type IV secretion system protein VirB10